MLGKSVTASIWRFGVEGSVKKEGTLWPFDKELLLGRPGADPHVGANEEAAGSRFSVEEAKRGK